jgi:hypothetical protein
MPSGFPADFPIYTGARLTAANSTPGSGSTKWTMEWQTLDTLSSVQAYYAVALDKNDWILLGYSGDINTRFSATFTRKSNHTLTNSLEVTNSAGLTKIDLVLNSIP